MTQSTETLVEALRRIRLERDLTYKEMGAKIGISAAAVWFILSGRVDPNDRTDAKIRRAFPEISNAA